MTKVSWQANFLYILKLDCNNFPENPSRNLIKFIHYSISTVVLYNKIQLNRGHWDRAAWKENKVNSTGDRAPHIQLFGRDSQVCARVLKCLIK